MIIRLASRMRGDDRGIAMLVVLLSVIVVTLLGSALVVSAVRDLESSTSVQRASTALGMAEAAIQHAMLVMKRFGPVSGNLRRLIPDKSIDTESPAEGRWMNATDPSKPPPENERYVGWVGTGMYTVHVEAVEVVKLPAKRVGTYKVVATGFDRRDRPSRPGERTVEQYLRVETLDMPFGLFSRGPSSNNGTPTLMRQSLWVDNEFGSGDVLYRNKIEFQGPQVEGCNYPEGCDIMYGWDGSSCAFSPASPPEHCPVTVHAMGTVYRGNGTNNDQNGPIHPPNANCDFPYDRDSRGAAYPSPWPCASPKIKPPYDTSKMTKADFPFDSDLLNPNGAGKELYQYLKDLAVSSGTYCVHAGGSTLIIPPAAGSPACANYPASIPPDRFFVMYVDVTGGGNVQVKEGWGPNVDPDSTTCDGVVDPNNPNDPDGFFGIVIVRNGNLDWSNNKNWWGAILAPEGTFSGSGVGGAWIVGTVYAKNFANTGNAKFQLNNCWLGSLAGPFFLVTRLRWHEADR